ncbi:cupin domain-containing protein [Terriglobus aquaticus]|uniref:Cupin domain-containing protein n=1 Tax=Terriglobus aquaticus TaxID=940139 RepID=A0ABW9KGK7_9BACT|nr:cupin domain-containing protein [Terriglobus aquaticus]
MSEIASRATTQQYSFDTMPLEQMSPTIARQFVTGDGAMLARIVLEKGAVVPEHSHHNEQISYILEGALRFVVGGEERVVRAGEVLVIPGNVPHSAEALERTVDLDVFTPPRQDWITGDDAYLRR